MAFLGPNNENLRAMQAHFPKLKIVARGTSLKAMGDREDLGRFEEVMRMGGNNSGYGGASALLGLKYQDPVRIEFQSTML